MWRNAEPGCENFPVPGGLIEHVDKVGVLKDVLHLAGGKQVLDVLGDPCWHTAPFPETLPNLDAVRRGLFLLKQQVELVQITPGGLARGAVGRYAAPDLILDDMHAQLLELLAQRLDVIADKAVGDVHVGLAVKDAEGAGHIDFQRRGDVLRLGFPLAAKGVVQIAQHGHVFGPRVCQIPAVHHAHGAVDHGLFDGHQAVSPAHDQLAQAENEIRFERDRVGVFGVVEVDVHGIDAVGTGGRNPDDLSMQRLHQRRVFSLRVADEDVVVCQQVAVGDLTLGAERFAAARRTQNQPVGVLELLAVGHDHVVGQGVEAVIHRLARGLEQLLRGEGHEDGRGAGGQRALNFQLVYAQRQRGRQRLLLLEVQAGELAVVFLRHALRLKDHVFKRLPVRTGVEHQKRDQKHALVSALQILQQLFGLRAVGGQVAGQDVHVVSGAHRPLLLLHLGLVQIGDLALDLLDGRVLVDGLDMHGDDEACVDVQKIGQHAVVEFRRENLKDAYRPQRAAHAKAAAFAKGEGRWSHEIPGGQPGGRKPLPFEAERLLRIGVEDAVQKMQPLPAVKQRRGDAHALEVGQNVQLDSVKARSGRLETVRPDAEGQVLDPFDAVAASGKLIAENLRVFAPDPFRPIPANGDMDAVFKAVRVGVPVQKGELEMDGAVEIVEEIAPALEDGAFGVIVRKLVVDVLKLKRLCVPATRQTDAVRPDAVIRDSLLRAARLPAVGAVFPDDGFDMLLFLAGELAGAELLHLLVDNFLAHQRTVDVIGPVRPGFRAANERVRHVAQHLFQRPAVVFVQAQQEKREHCEHHADGRGA